MRPTITRILLKTKYFSLKWSNSKIKIHLEWNCWKKIWGRSWGCHTLLTKNFRIILQERFGLKNPKLYATVEKLRFAMSSTGRCVMSWWKEPGNRPFGFGPTFWHQRTFTYLRLSSSTNKCEHGWMTRAKISLIKTLAQLQSGHHWVLLSTTTVKSLGTLSFC